MTAIEKTAYFFRENGTLRKKSLAYALPILIGMGLGILVLFAPLNYVIFIMAGLFFAYLVFCKIEVAIIVALLLQYQLARFNYLGGGTPFHPNGVMGIALIAGAGFYFMTHKIDFSRFKAIGGFLAFLGVGILSLASAGTYLMDGVTITLRLVTSLAIYAVLIHKLDSITQVKWVIGAIIAAQVIPTLSGLLMVAGKTGWLFTDETMRLGNSGVGVYLAVVSILCVVFLFSAKTTLSRMLWGMLSALFLVGLFFSYGRSGWIGFALAMLFISMIRFRRLIFILPLVLILAILLIPAIGQRFADISFSAGGSGGESTLSGRFAYWQAALTIYPQHPILGVGLGVGRYRVGEFRGLYPNMIHNDYISALLETGLVGLLGFIFWHAQWLAALIKTYRVSASGFDKTVTLAVLTVLISSLVMRITDNILLDSFDMYPLCAMVAATLVIPRIRKQAADVEPRSSLASGGLQQD